jgi:glycosyltransferase involved in cell wall biosynthesis
MGLIHSKNPGVGIICPVTYDPSLKTLTIHLGRRNAGPQLNIQLAKSLDKMDLLAGIVTSEATHFEFKEFFKTIDFRNVFHLKTFNSRSGFILRLLNYRNITREIEAIVSKVEPEVIILPMQHALDLVVFRALKKSKKRVTTVSWVHDLENHPGDSKILSRVMNTVTFHYSDVLVVLSKTVEGRLISHAKKPFIRIDHPIQDLTKEISETKFSKLDENLKILFAGRLIKYKGLERLSAAWEIIRDQYPNAELTVAGDGDRKYAEGCFKDSKQVSLITEYFDPISFELLFKEANIVVIPYDEASQSGILAMSAALKKAYVVTPVSGLIEQATLNGGGLIAKNMTPESFAESVIELIEMGGSLTYKSNSNLSWMTQTQILMSALHKLLKKAKA